MKTKLITLAVALSSAFILVSGIAPGKALSKDLNVPLGSICQESQGYCPSDWQK